MDEDHQITGSPSGFLDLCSIADVTNKGAISFSFIHDERGRHDVGVFWDGESIYSIDNWCPHADGFLHQGEILTRRVICPIHQAVFDLLTGRCLDYYTHDVQAYEVRLENGRVWGHLPNEHPYQHPESKDHKSPPELHS